jgi:hypothetical protein
MLDEDDRKLPAKSEAAEEDELSIHTESDGSYTLSAKKPKQEEDLYTYIMKTFLPTASIDEQDAVKYTLFKLGFRDVISFNYFYNKTAYTMYQQLGKFFVNKYLTLLIHLFIISRFLNEHKYDSGDLDMKEYYSLKGKYWMILYVKKTNSFYYR